MAEVDLSYVGAWAQPYVVDVERDMVRRFARAIGDLNPIRSDLDAAHRAGYSDLVASLTFPVSLRAPVEPIWLHGLERSRILAGEIGFDIVTPLLAGTRVHCHTQLVRVDEKMSRNGVMHLLRQKTVGTAMEKNGALGAHLFSIHRTTVYRAAPSNATPMPAGEKA